jgi:hypothetical protein
VSARGIARLALGLCGGASLVSCLPADTRPTPGSLVVTVSSDDQLRNGIEASATVDGWSIEYDRFLVNLGRASLDGDPCNAYSNPAYTRIFDMKTQGAQRVSLLYALGQCDFGFNIGNPNADSLLGAGVTEADATFMRTPGEDPYAGVSGVTIHVKGHASNGAEKKTFTWDFRKRAQYHTCKTSSGAGIDMQGSAAATVDIRIRGGVLFADGLGDDARLRFGVFADADTKTGDGDGDVTLDELARVPIAAAGLDTGDGGAFLDDGGIAGVPRGFGPIDAGSSALDGGAVHGLTLRDYVYLALFPNVPRFEDDGTCSVSLRSRGR